MGVAGRQSTNFLAIPTSWLERIARLCLGFREFTPSPQGAPPCSASTLNHKSPPGSGESFLLLPGPSRIKQTGVPENSLVVQWLGLCTLTVEGPGSIPGRGSKIPQATRRSPKKKKKKSRKAFLDLDRARPSPELGLDLATPHRCYPDTRPLSWFFALFLSKCRARHRETR